MEYTLIIYPSSDIEGGLTSIHPAPECELTIEEIALKDVPAGVPFLLVPAEQAPQDYTFFNAFEADFSNPDGHGLGAEAFWAQKTAAANLEVSE